MNIALEHKKAQRAVKLPSKTHINLAKKESKKRDATTLGIGAGIIVILMILVAKFGVYDQYARLQKAESDYDAVHAQYVEMENALADYPNVLDRYRTYARSWMEQSDENGFVQVDRMDILDLLENYMIPYGTLNNFTIQDSTVIVSMSGMNLQEISNMFARLQSRPIVDSVSLNLASTEETDKNTDLDFSVTIQLKSENADTTDTADTQADTQNQEEAQG